MILENITSSIESDQVCPLRFGGSPTHSRPVNIELLNTGSELMLGRVLNTHQQWLCRQMAASVLVTHQDETIGPSICQR